MEAVEIIIIIKQPMSEVSKLIKKSTITANQTHSIHTEMTRNIEISNKED